MNLLRLITGNAAVARSSRSLAAKVSLRVVAEGWERGQSVPVPVTENMPGRSLPYVARLTALLGEATLAAARAIRRPARFPWHVFVHHIGQTGLNAVPTVVLVCALAGAVVMQQGIVIFRTVNAELYAVQMLGVLAMRDMGVLLASIVVAVRSASAFAAEIGALRGQGGVEAIRGRGEYAVTALVLPRLAALAVAMPLLVFIAGVACLAGGALVAAVYSGLDIAAFAAQLQGAVTPRNLLVGLVKAPFAALAIGLAGCLEGLGGPSGADATAGHVRRAVVRAVLLVLVCGALFTMFLTVCGI